MAIKVLVYNEKNQKYHYSGNTLDTYHCMPKCGREGCQQDLQVLCKGNKYSIGCPVHGSVLLDTKHKLRSPVELVISYYTHVCNGLGDELGKYIDKYGALEDKSTEEK